MNTSAMPRLWLLLAAAAALVAAKPTSMLAVTPATSAATGASQKDGAAPQLKSMHVSCNVTNRYGRTVVSSRYANPAEVAREATFSVVLPDAAFITGFVMEIGGKAYEAYVREKEQARQEYQQAVASGASAAHVELNARDSNRFTVSVNVEPHAKVLFNLSYEQLLQRHHGRYELLVNLHPGQYVEDMRVDVNIHEAGRLVDLNVPNMRSGNDISDPKANGTQGGPPADVKLSEDGKSGRVSFAPDKAEQKRLAAELGGEDAGLAGQFVVQYDVERDSNGGLLLYGDGHFVHFLAPDVPSKPVPRHIVFVLDFSGSMLGRKSEQLRQAMKIILDQLNPDDHFHLVEFSTTVKVYDLENPANTFRYASPDGYGWWRPSNDDVSQSQHLPAAAPADAEHVRLAKNIVDEMNDWGGTNIQDALLVALNLTAGAAPAAAPGGRGSVPTVVFLTDGDATVGETRPGHMLEAVESQGKGRATIFALAFGDDANQEFLRRLSLRHGGFMRHIYEGPDAALQLQDFYQGISYPLLSNVTFEYAGGEPASLTKSSFRTLFKGGELVVAGSMASPPSCESFAVHGLSVDGPIDWVPRCVPQLAPADHAVGPLERLWAFLSVKQLLDRRDELDAEDADAEKLKQSAMKLALKYSFVTPVTSLVVVKPNETSQIDPEAAADSTNGFPFPSGGYPISAISAGSAGAYGAPLHGLAGPPGFGMPPMPVQKMHSLSMPITLLDVRYELDSDSDSVVPEKNLASTFRPITFKSTTTFRSTTALPVFPELPWLQVNDDAIMLDGKRYDVGNNATHIEPTPCKVQSLEIQGNCTLLHSCPQIYPKLHDLESYKTYFCALDNDRYAGVCCVEEIEE